MGLHYDALKGFITYASKDLDQPTMPAMKSYLEGLLETKEAHYYVPYSKNELLQKSGVDLDTMVGALANDMNTAKDKGQLLNLPYKAVLIEDVDSMVVIDQEYLKFRTTIFGVDRASGDITLGSAIINQPEHLQAGQFFFYVQKPVYVNIWKDGVSYANYLDHNEIVRAMAEQLTNATFIALQELMYLKMNDAL